MLLHDGHVTTSFQTRSIAVGGRTGPVNRQGVRRQHLDELSRVPPLNERPAALHQAASSLWGEWEPASVK